MTLQDLIKAIKSDDDFGVFCGLPIMVDGKEVDVELKLRRGDCPTHLELIGHFYDDTEEAIDEAKRKLAWAIHERICKGDSLQDIDKFVTDICDF